MNRNSFYSQDLKSHIIFWTVLTAYLAFIDSVEGPFAAQIIGTFLIMISYIITFYILRYIILPKYWKKNYTILSISFTLVYIIYVSLDIFNFYWVIPAFGGEKIYENLGNERIFMDGFLAFFLILIAAFSLYFNQLAIETLKQQNEREKSLIVKELNFLKNQFNSHITFNFLNFCYSQVHNTVPKVADAIELFSGILRYSLSLTPEEKISLEEEVEYIRSYIELQKLLSSTVYVNFEIKGRLDSSFILPRILVSFVENSFKHGIYNIKEEPLTIKLEVLDNIRFQIKNRKNLQNKVIKTGIGQDNVKQILELFYKNKYDLKIDDNENYYSLDLSLKS